MPWKRAIFSIWAVLTASGLSFKLPAGFLNLAFSLFPFWAHCLCWEGRRGTSAEVSIRELPGDGMLAGNLIIILVLA